MEVNLHQELLQKARTYPVPPKALDLLKNNPPLIIAGLAASGKNTISVDIAESSDYRHVITHTTRPKRHREKNGQNYWFVSEAGMLKLINEQALIETQAIHGETVYGTSIASYEKIIGSNQRPLLIMDVQGIAQLNKHLPGLKPIFVLPPDFKTWMERLGNRGFISDVDKMRRLRAARIALQEALANRHFIMVVNREVPRAAREILNSLSSGDFAQHQNRELARNLIDHLQAY